MIVILSRVSWRSARSPSDRLSKPQHVQLSGKRQYFTPDGQHNSQWDRVSLLRHQNDLPRTIAHIPRYRCAAAAATWWCLAQDKFSHFFGVGGGKHKLDFRTVFPHSARFAARQQIHFHVFTDPEFDSRLISRHTHSNLDCNLPVSFETQGVVMYSGDADAGPPCMW